MIFAYDPGSHNRKPEKNMTKADGTGSIQAADSLDKEDTNKRLAYEQFIKREYNLNHLAVEQEFAFYNAVKMGDLLQVRKIMLPLHDQQLGKLSDNRIRNLKYHLIITIALITRFCIEGGMQSEDAYTLSDIYIQKLDKMSSEDELSQLHQKVILDYTRKMQKIHHSVGVNFSRNITRIMDYVYDHLHEKISLDSIAQTLGMNKTYLCKAFKDETDMSIGNYIILRKVEAAQNMLVYSDYSFIEISNILGFSSHSHFIECFKKITGMTPKKYRDTQFRQGFNKD